jgi:uncharacterized protein
MRLNLFGPLLPREEQFIELFCEQSKMLSAAASELHALIEGGNGELEARVAAIRRLETEADAVARRIIIAANRTFNAPMDRENILELAHELDDVVDLIEQTAKEILRYEIREFPAEMKRMAAAVVRCGATIEQLIPLLGEITRQHKRIGALCAAIGDTEGEADACLDAGLTELRSRVRRGEIDALDYVDRKEIYEHLEAVVDKCDDVANVVQTITAKHV